VSGRDGTDSQVATVSDIRIQVAEAVGTSSSLPARGRTSAVEELDTADSGGTHHTRKVFTGTRRRTAIRVTGRNSCHAARNWNSELLRTDIVLVFCLTRFF